MECVLVGFVYVVVFGAVFLMWFLPKLWAVVCLLAEFLWVLSGDLAEIASFVISRLWRQLYYWTVDDAED